MWACVGQPRPLQGVGMELRSDPGSPPQGDTPPAGCSLSLEYPANPPAASDAALRQLRHRLPLASARGPGLPGVVSSLAPWVMCACMRRAASPVARCCDGFALLPGQPAVGGYAAGGVLAQPQAFSQPACSERRRPT